MTHLQNSPAQNRRQFLRDYLARHSLITGGDIKLSGGGVSSFYFNCKKATLNGEFLCALADWVLDEVACALTPAADAVGGPTLGADFIAAAVAMRAHQRGIALTHGCIVRKEAKAHGTQSAIENAPPPRARVLVVEDVITSGGSAARACEALLAAGYSIAAVAVIIDREAGGRQQLEKQFNAPVYALFNRADFPEAAAAEPGT